MSNKKIKTREELESFCREWRAEGLTVGFTSGAFDLLHAGHVEHLEKAKDRCDILLVGLNSDSSVKRYKGEGRPIMPASERAKILAALGAVDFVFIFEERRNHTNIQKLQPDYYIKAGDYSADQLTSKDALDEYGGEVLLIPIETKSSTSKIIAKIQSISNDAGNSVVEFERAVYFPTRKTKAKPAIFLDRDGTINEEIEYLHEPEKFKLLPNALTGLKKLRDMDYRLIIVTTQAGIGLGYFTKEDFFRVNRKMFGLLADENIEIDKIYFCPHNVTEDCSCRKPKIGLIEQAQKDLNIDMAHSYIIGDKTADIQAGVNANLRTILVQTGHAGKDKEFPVQPDFVAEDLLDAANWILTRERE
jgi:D-glycero-D-manno-heptose 1,7-bisphosphate phosphatase